MSKNKNNKKKETKKQKKDVPKKSSAEIFATEINDAIGCAFTDAFSEETLW